MIADPTQYRERIVAKSKDVAFPDTYAWEAKDSQRTQTGGNHYAKCAIEPVDYIMANGLDYLQGNVVKYVTRHKDKNGAEDIRKCIDYCNMILEKQYESD